MEDFPIRTLEMVCLGSSVALSGLFYYIYRKKCKTVDKLNEAPVLPLDEKLADLLNATPGKCLQYVVVEGTVQSIGEPLRSQFQEGSVGVIQKLVLREHKLVWNSLARTWTDSERVLHQRVNAVPFNLLGVNKAFVRVLCPLEATGPKMEIVHEKFHQASYGFTDLIGQYLSGEKPKGQLETEEMLKVGASLTAVGELILDTDRLPKIRPPTDGSEYFLSTDDFETLRLEQEGQAEVWRVLACICALAGVAVLMWAGRRYYRQLKLRWEQENMRREFEMMGAGERGEEENGMDVSENACVICLSNPRGCVLLDCGHVCCCFRCYQALPQPICPICRQNIKRVVPLYQA
ncbi:mitochondrial ubiquitin ligase activator of nfkb 1-A [Sinocyclocheilus grahami]|uniref:RING-type E3 ubiquitin transferase n=1 Tax=Sinocyclocheilus grahami TaxID=75366 RepID=A0A672RQR4_SINGR|nr:PREDICTED: mitochondrial ubiquitin ligase activator of nfkb 1-A [Sinocyclocheilus grahami]XP_016096944.1 PREDICTED: mitochondrial ubiquitin ligase activator of nfkb 1-A [Sinocyclocheilus grahami]XP_016096945.1 PREDICTED: mitochondrial ubiquitin ligase activator of nfkb 1-A [Sinocyclocheilus grahami]